MISLSADFISHLCYAPLNDWVKYNPRREGDTASSLREQMSMLGQKGLAISGCGGNSVNLGVYISCREIERPQERARIKQAGFWGDENNVARPGGDKGRGCCNSESLWIACLEKDTVGRQTSDCRNNFHFHSFFSACFEFTQRMFLTIIMNNTINIITNRSFGSLLVSFWSSFSEVIYVAPPQDFSQYKVLSQEHIRRWMDGRKKRVPYLGSIFRSVSSENIVTFLAVLPYAALEYSDE